MMMGMMQQLHAQKMMTMMLRAEQKQMVMQQLAILR
jgi:hypothetical protein